MHQKFKTSDHITDYAIGDVHGCVEQLRIALDWCAADALQSGTRGRVHLLGDYVDRGPSSREVIDLLIAGPQESHMSWHPIKGNHDDMFSSVWFDPSHNLATAWWEHGGQQTLQSYGWNPLYNPIPDTLDEFVPEEHAEFLRSLPMTAETDTHIYVHAGLRPGVDLEKQSLHDMMWIRGEFNRSCHDFGKVVVYGHTPDKKNPCDHGNRIAMDSGCFGSGVLSVVAFDDSGRSLRFQTITLESTVENVASPKP
ncbi:metallophosphoesterase family protein [Mesorhizobium sp. SP-1A]|uniref:metallophosphoesterase family protein n=1 Tax=Mesorhizobium sp. SP-1A TaxID=3077840 RepID=UPI0028F70215|nr:metallophosphoesterase family protein [Mesorhizobium sp. SP-1A]